jgi:hypothetical protein
VLVRRRLSLRREALAALTTDELSGVVGAIPPPPTPPSPRTVPVTGCLSLVVAGCGGAP